MPQAALAVGLHAGILDVRVMMGGQFGCGQRILWQRLQKCFEERGIELQFAGNCQRIGPSFAFRSRTPEAKKLAVPVAMRSP